MTDRSVPGRAEPTQSNPVARVARTLLSSTTRHGHSDIPSPLSP